MKLTWPRFFLAFFIVAFVVAIPIALHAEDGRPESQVAHSIRTPQMLFADAASAQPTPITEHDLATPPSVITRAPTVTPAPASPTTDFAQWALGLFGAALSAVATWALSLIAAKFHIDAKGAAMASLTHLVDEGIDWVRKWAIAEAGTLLDQDNQVTRVFNMIWPLAKPFVASIGWTEDHLRTYIGTRLAPTTP